MNFAAMKIALKRYGFDDSDPLGTWLNAALHDFESSFDWPFSEILLSVPVAAGLSSAVIGSDNIKIIYIRDTISQRKLRYINRRQLIEAIPDLTVQGSTEFYTLTGTTVVQFYPVPQLAMQLEVLYQGRWPDLVADADVPGPTTSPAPLTCHYPIVARAASIALQAENEEDRAQQAEREYQSMLMRQMGKFGERELDEVETVQDAQGYGSGYRLSRYS